MRQIVVTIEAGEKNCEDCEWAASVSRMCGAFRNKRGFAIQLRQKDCETSPRRCAECLKREIEPGAKC